MEITKGKVLSINGDKAKVAPMDDIDAVTSYLKIPRHLENENIQKDDAVAFVAFSDGSGVILAKL